MSFFHIFWIVSLFLFAICVSALPPDTPPLGRFILSFSYWFFIISIHTYYKSEEKHYHFKKSALLALGIALLTSIYDFAAEKTVPTPQEKAEIPEEKRPMGSRPRHW